MLSADSILKAPETHNSKTQRLKDPKFLLTWLMGIVKLAMSGGWFHEESVGCFGVFGVRMVLCRQ